MRPLLTILAVLLALGSVEGLAWWWMNPAHAETAEPVLTFRPGIVSESTPAPSPNPQSPISNLSSSPTPLPEIYRQAAPMLRCTSGQVFHVQIHETASLHGAFFEWDGTDTGSVLEAFRHMPEACLGSIGMQLVSKEKPIPFQVGLNHRADRDSQQLLPIKNHQSPPLPPISNLRFPITY